MLSMRSPMPHVLLVDDEEPMRVSLSFTLKREGYEVTCAEDGPTALRLAREAAPDVILLDLMLPGLDGMEVCRRVRSFSDVPILMLTAKDQELDKVLGLEIGADDYVTKPFSTRELLARTKALLRRSSTRVVMQGTLAGGPVTIDLDRHVVTLHDRVVELSPREYQLLRVLISNRGRAVLREELLQSVWGRDFIGDLKTLDVHIRWLREKIEADPSNPQLIVTVRGTGYRYDG
jgi:two-component system response regulator RegX3